GMTLLTHREPGKQGYFLLTISPKDDLAEQEYASKDIVFVLDTSGSMAEAGKMEKARAALLFGVRSLRDGDRFNVINFAGEEHLMASSLIQADAAGRARGEDFVKALRPLGGTNINDSLVAAMRQFNANEDRPRMLVFLTDGLPTVGVTNVQKIIENARGARAPGTRLFTFGVGYDVNTALLDKLAAENGGVAEYVEPKEDIEVKVGSFFNKINHPVLTDLRLDTGGVETDLVYPRALPDLFRGSQVTIIGRYRNPSDARNVTLRLTGRTGQRERTFVYENVSFPLTTERNEFLPRLWATRRVGWLMEQVRTNGEQKELVDEVVDLGTRYGIVTPYTSYLALEPGMEQVTDATAAPVTRQDTRTLRMENRAPSRIPPGANRSGGGGGGGGLTYGGGAQPSPKDAQATTGATAVRESKRARAQQEVLTEAEDDDEVLRVGSDKAKKESVVRKIGDKTFYLREGVWTDSEFKEEARLPETTLVFGSDEYFALAAREPQLARFFALGERVLVVFKGRVYRVNAK
ncbi:MAG TPA: VWA domain-containing protein, partial [Pyrinomonadaceae bacterium]